MDTIEVRNAILCEDIRHEIGNKNSLIGVFGGDILVAELPARIRVAVYYDAMVSVRGKIQSEIKLQFGDAPPILGGQVQDVQTPILTAATPTLDLTIETEGVFSVSVRFEGQDWKEIIRKDISLDKSLANPSSI